MTTKKTKKQAEEIITFDNLLTEVIDEGLCNRCGGCVSFCSADRIGALKMSEDGYPEYADEDKCLECGICYLICPQTKTLKDDVKEKFGWKPPIGAYKEIFSGRATDAGIRNVATDGGVVTALLVFMLENNLIDGAVVSQKTGPFNREPIVATSREQLIQAAGSQWSETAHLQKMGNEYSTFVPMITTIRDLAPKYPTKLAVVGTPCQIQAIRKMQVLKILPADVVTFTIGLFCMQSFALNELLKQEFTYKHNINMKNIEKLNIKEDFIIRTDSGVNLHIPLNEIEGIARPACLYCEDFANDFADISVGGLGSPDGYTSVIIRNNLGKKMYARAMQRGYIENKVDAGSSKAQAESERILYMVEEFTARKIARAKRAQGKTL